jgi:hypothetical protein
MLSLVNKRWKATFISHFGTEVTSETQRGAEALARDWLENEYGHDLARATEIEVEVAED